MAFNFSAFKSFERPAPQVVDLSNIITSGSVGPSQIQVGERWVMIPACRYASQYSAYLLDPLSLAVHALYGFPSSYGLLEELNGYLWAAWGGVNAVEFRATNSGEAAKNLYDNAGAAVRTLPPHAHLSQSSNLSNSWYRNANVASGIGAVHPGNYEYAYRFSRFRGAKTAPKAANDTYPTITDPTDAPTVAADTSGGFLADATYDVKIAWMTKRNSTKTAYGATLPTAAGSATVSGGSGLGKIDVTIPTLPANVAAALVYVGVQGQALYLVGIKKAAGTFTITWNPVAWNLHNKLWLHDSAGRVTTLDVTSCATQASTALTAAAHTSNYGGPIWTPFAKNSNRIWVIQDTYNSGYARPMQVGYNNLASASLAVTALADPVTDDEDPILYGGIDSRWCTIACPELGGVFVVQERTYRNGSICLVSSVDGSVLWSGPNYGLDDSTAYALLYDYQVIDGAVFLVFLNLADKCVVRYPVVLNDRV